MISLNSYLKLMKEDIRHRGWLAVLVAVMMLLIFPVNYLMQIENKLDMLTWKPVAYTMEQANAWFKGYILFDNHMFIVIAGICAVVLGITGYVYLHSREKLDFYHSFPIRREITGSVSYLSGILMFAVPYAVSYVLGIIVGSIKGLKVEGVLSCALKSFSVNLLCFLLVYTITITAMLLTGKIIVGLLGTGVILVYGSLIAYVIKSMMSVFFSTYYQLYTEAAVGYGPVGQISSLISALQSERYAVKNIAVIVATVVVFTVLNWFLCKVRPSESAGSAMAFPIVEAPLKALIAIPCALVTGIYMSALSASRNKWFLIIILIAVVLYSMVIEFIYHMDLKMIMGRWKSSFAGILVTLFVFLLFRYDWVGFDTYLPKESELQFIGLDTSASIGYPAYPFENESGYQTIRLDKLSTEDFQPIYELLSRIVPENRTFENTDAQMIREFEAKAMQSVGTVFVRKDGKKIYRYYLLDKNELDTLVNEMTKSQDYKEKIFPAYYLDEESIYSVVPDGLDQTQKIPQIYEMEAKALYEAYIKDMDAVDIQTLRADSPVGMVTFTTGSEYGKYYYEFYVYSGFTNTRELLKEYGYEFAPGIPAEEISRIEIVSQAAVYEEKIAMDSQAVAATAERDASTVKSYTDIKDIKEILAAITYRASAMGNAADPTYSATVYWKNGLVQNYEFREGCLPDSLKQ